MNDAHDEAMDQIAARRNAILASVKAAMLQYEAAGWNYPLTLTLNHDGTVVQPMGLVTSAPGDRQKEATMNDASINIYHVIALVAHDTMQKWETYATYPTFAAADRACTLRNSKWNRTHGIVCAVVNMR